MHSKRIVRIQKRAKRRLIALTVVAAVIAGYSSRSLFAVEEPASQSITKIISKPGVKALGIRLIHPSGDSQAAGNTSAPNMQSTLPLPRQVLPPTTATLPVPMMPTLPTNSALASNSPQLQPAPSFNEAPSLPSSGFSLLPAPPRMSEVPTKNPSGKVVMKLGSGTGGDSTSCINTSNQSSMVKVIESDESEIVASRPLGPPAKMPPFLFEKSPQKGNATANAGSNAVQSAIRISIADSSSGTSVGSPIDQPAGSLAPPKNRTPQLVKPKPTQLGHTVVLAQSTELESHSSSDQPDELVPPVEVDASLVPNAITSGASGFNPIGPNFKSGGPTKAVVSDAVDDAFISFVPPAVEQSGNATNAADAKTVSHGSELQLAKLDAVETVDSSRRKFDAKMLTQSPSAVVELECLTATSMDLSSKLTALAVQDENICKVLHNGRTISIVGNQQGTSLVQIWTSDLGERPQLIRVNVSQQRGKVQATRNEVKDIKQVIAQSFPGADVNIISKDDGSIEVRGKTESEESAKRILELVRKLYLVPVKDKLTVVK